MAPGDLTKHSTQRESTTTTGIATVPTQAARSGHVASGDITVDPAVQRYLGLFALPNGPVSGDTGLYRFPSKAVVPEHCRLPRHVRDWMSEISLVSAS
jgi:hypothetical protein